MAGAGGNVTGGMGNFVQKSAVAYLQSLGANQVKQIADALDSDTARAALRAVVGCAGAAASQSCASGALGAAGGSILNNLLDQVDKGSLTPADKENRANLVSSLVAGITSAAGGSAATAANAARIETENNRLATSAEVKRIRQLSQGDPQKEARLTAAMCALIHCEREYPEGSQAYELYKSLSDLGSSEAFKAERALLAEQKDLQIRAGILRGVDVQPLLTYDWKDRVGDATTRMDNTYQVSTRAMGGLQAIGGGASAVAGGTLATGGAAACGPTAGASCLAAAGGVALTFWGLDQAKAGVGTMISGQPQATVGGIVLQQVFGISPEAAELLYGVAGGAAGIAGDIALARMAPGARFGGAGKAGGEHSTQPPPANTSQVDAEIDALRQIAQNPKGPVLVDRAPNSVLNQQAIKDLEKGTLPGVSVDPKTGLPDAVQRIGVPREMPASANPWATAEDFALRVLGRAPTADELRQGAGMNRGNCPGCWLARPADGTYVTYRPAGNASGNTLSNTATVEFNNPATINMVNGGDREVLKLKFPEVSKP